MMTIGKPIGMNNRQLRWLMVTPTESHKFCFSKDGTSCQPQALNSCDEYEDIEYEFKL